MKAQTLTMDRTISPNTDIQHPYSYSTVQVKAILYHLDGVTSEITMNIPRYTRWAEPYESAFARMEQYVNFLAAHWIKISHFDLESYTFKPNGESAGFLKKSVEIPLGKVYDTKTCKWVPYEDVKEKGYEWFR